MRRGSSVVLVVLLVFVLAPAAFAQITTGSIRGAVSDAQGAVLPGVTITVTSPALVRGSVSVVSDDRGEFRVPGLQPGVYVLSAELSGFVPTKVEGVVVRLEQDVAVTLTLQLAGVSESVVVSALPQVVESTVVGLRERIAPATIDSIPLNGRQFLDLVQLVPGTAPRPPDVQDGSGATILGGRSINNGFLIDGMQNRDNLSGNFKEFFAQDAIQEFNVNVAGFQPEYGLASGAVINIITKSGSNDFSGRGSVYGRNDSLDSSNNPGQPPPKLKRVDAALTVGGPIVRDRTWFFNALEFLNEERGTNLDRSQIPPIIASGFVSPAFDGAEPFDAKPLSKRLTEFAKISHRLNASNELFASTNINHRKLDAFVRPSGGSAFISPPAGSVSLPSTASDIRETIYSVNGRETSFFGGNRWLIESTLRYVRGDYKENTELGGGGHDEISTLTFGPNGHFWNTNYPLGGAQRTLDQRIEWGEDLSYFRGKHSVKAGFHLDKLKADGFFRAPTLNILGNTALEARYVDLGMDLTSQKSLNVLIPNPDRDGYAIHDTVYSAFVQDNWQVASNLNINGGIRWDYETLFEGANTNFGPRVGFTWDPWNNGRTVVRGSAGVFYDAELLNPALRIEDLGGMTFGSFSLWNLPRGAAFFNNPALNALGPLQAGGTRFLANPTFFSYILPAGTALSSGGISIVGRGQPYIIYDLLGIPVPNPSTPPLLTSATIPSLTGGRVSPQAALDLLNQFFPNPRGFPQFFFIPTDLAGQTMKEGTLAFKSTTENVIVQTIQTIERPFKTPYVTSLNGGVERELFGDISVDFEYFFRKGHHLLARRVVNLRDQPISSSCIGNTVDGQPCNSQLQSIGFSNVHAATLAVRKRLSRRHSFLFSYTYTHAIDNFNTLNTRGPANFNLNNRPQDDIGRSLNSPVHVLVLSGSYNAPLGFDVSGVFRADSGRPFNAAGLPQDTDGDGNFDDRLLGTEKGGYTSAKTIQLDLRVAKTFGPKAWRTMIIAEMFNVANRRNPLTVNRTLGPNIGQTIEALPGREVQLGVRVDF